MTAGFKPNMAGNSLKRQAGVGQQGFGLLDADLQDVIMKGQPCLIPEAGLQLILTEPDFNRELLSRNSLGIIFVNKVDSIFNTMTIIPGKPEGFIEAHRKDLHFCNNGYFIILLLIRALVKRFWVFWVMGYPLQSNKSRIDIIMQQWL